MRGETTVLVCGLVEHADSYTVIFAFSQENVDFHVECSRPPCYVLFGCSIDKMQSFRLTIPVLLLLSLPLSFSLQSHLPPPTLGLIYGPPEQHISSAASGALACCHSQTARKACTFTLHVVI